MRTKRAERMSKEFSGFLNNSVLIAQETWTHKVEKGTTTKVKLSYFVGGNCHQQNFDNLDETQNFIDNYMEAHVRNPILFRKF